MTRDTLVRGTDDWPMPRISNRTMRSCGITMTVSAFETLPFCATALLVYLDPMAVGLSDIEPSLPIQFDRHWSPEIRLGLGGDVVGSVDVRGQFRDQVGHLPRAFLVWVDVEEVRSPLGQRSLAPELELEAAVGTQHLHPLVAPVGDVDVPLRVHCHDGG